MAWGKVDDKLWGSPKWLATPPRARGLWVTGLSWCMDQLTDGLVPTHVLPSLGGTRTDARDLVSALLWEEVDGGWLYHDWHDYQPSREKVLKERAEAAERQKRAREKAREKRAAAAGVTDMSRRDSRVSHADVTGVVTVPPTRPDPTRPELRLVGPSSSSSPDVSRGAATRMMQGGAA